MYFESKNRSKVYFKYYPWLDKRWTKIAFKNMTSISICRLENITHIPTTSPTQIAIFPRDNIVNPIWIRHRLSGFLKRRYYCDIFCDQLKKKCGSLILVGIWHYYFTNDSQSLRRSYFFVIYVSTCISMVLNWTRLMTDFQGVSYRKFL